MADRSRRNPRLARIEQPAPPAPEPPAPAPPAPPPAPPANRTDATVQPPRQMAPQPVPGAPEPFESPSAAPAVTKFGSDASADHVVQLTDEEFGKALNLSFLDRERPAPASEPAAVPPQEALRQAAPQEPPPEAPATEEEAPPAEEAAEEEGETEVLALEAPEVPFAVFDAEGELEIPDLRFNFRGDGKDYTNVPLDRLVRFAQMGVYNAAKEAKFADLGAKVPLLERRASAAEQRAKELEGFYERLLSDPAYYERASALYSEQNTPEQRIARAEEEKRTMQAQFDLEREEMRRRARAESEAAELQRRHDRDSEEQQAATFVRSELAPAVERLIRSNPLVSEREILGQYTLLTAPLLDRGRVPLNRLAQVRELVADLGQWAQGLQAEREFSAQRTDERVTSAQTAAAMAKRQVARAAAPHGRPAPAGPPAPKRYGTVDDWLKDGLGGNVPPLEESGL